MLINWFTVFAQIVNFLILVLLLKRFLYKPILEAMAERQRQILLQLENAEKAREESERERRELMRKNEEFEKERAAKVKALTDEIEERRKHLMEELRREMDRLQARWNESLRLEQKSFQTWLGKVARRELYVVLNKTLEELADASLEERMATVFLGRLQVFLEENGAGCLSRDQGGHGPVVVRSSRDLSPGLRAALITALGLPQEDGGRITFESLPELICGIELLIGGQKVSWTISEYLTNMEERVNELVDREQAERENEAARP